MVAAKRYKKISRLFAIIVVLMSIIGYVVFLSAVLGRTSQDFSSFIFIAVKQLIILVLSLSIFGLVSKLPFNFWRKYALPIFILGVVVTLAVFIPGLGLESGGAKRWISLGNFSFQTSEILKFGFVLYFAAWLAAFKDKAKTFKYGLLPFIILASISGGILYLQPDTGTFVVIAATGMAMFIIAGGKWRHLAVIVLLGISFLAMATLTRPYIKDRIITYLNPQNDLLGSSYQINQSLIAIGAGGLTGRGFGQSVQKFSFLPQPIGDSIFSVAAEEFGFIGAIIILLFFTLYGLIGLKIASQASNTFGRLLATGIVILVVSQSFINIGAMIGILPLTGIPLVFFSQGGSALLFALLESGIVLSISKQT